MKNAVADGKLMVSPFPNSSSKHQPHYVYFDVWVPVKGNICPYSFVLHGKLFHWSKEQIHLFSIHFVPFKTGQPPCVDLGSVRWAASKLIQNAADPLMGLTVDS